MEHQSMSIDQLQPANQRDVSVYYTSRETQYATPPISLYQKGVLERKIEASDSIPFVATWNVSNLPADLTVAGCNLTAMQISYEIMMTSSELVGFLIDVILNFKRARIIDFSRILP